MVKANEIVYHDHKDNTTIGDLPANSDHGIEILGLSQSAERAFCIDCHTPLGMRYKHIAEAHSITLGSVDEETIRDTKVKEALSPQVHIFDNQRAWWCEGIGKDSLGRCERFSGTFEEDIKAWEAANL